ncbi:MAG: in [Acidobacteriota bacterium]|jgi:subtilisin family serine protease|nr:in [Acidobacteriota bacterium]
MTPNITEQMESTGFAQVIVVIEPGAAAAAAGIAADVAMPPIRTVAAELERCFIRAEHGQDAALSRQNAAAVGLALDAPTPPKVRAYEHLGIILGTVDSTGLAALRSDRRVREVTGAPQLRLIRPVAARSATLAGTPTWGIERLEIPRLWDAGLQGQGVLIGHLDTGVDSHHPAFSGGAIAHFAEFDRLGNPVPGARPHDTGRHGTHTAGTLVGRPVDGTAFGCAPEAQLASAIVIEGGNVVARILAGMDWIVGLRARVLSMSLGLPGFHPDFLPVTRILRARGVLPVFAVGNEGPGSSRSPGNYPETLSVGAMNVSDEVADFSSSQTFARLEDPLVPDLVAPGVDVFSSVPGAGFMEMSGSSMATPHVAGLAALLFQAVPTATVDEVESAIFGSCKLVPGMPAERANRGIPNAPAALSLLRGLAMKKAA